MTQRPKLQSEHASPKENTVGKFSIPFHITGKQSDWDEAVAMQEASVIT